MALVLSACSVVLVLFVMQLILEYRLVGYARIFEKDPIEKRFHPRARGRAGTFFGWLK